ncbi:MAG: hypothetical protein ACYDCI_03645 [Candidatus Limnocylindrales bacterium]
MTVSGQRFGAAASEGFKPGGASFDPLDAPPETPMRRRGFQLDGIG